VPGVVTALRSAWALLTAVGGAAPVQDRVAMWFGPVGLVLGAVLGGAWWGVGTVAPPLVAAVLVIALDAGLTGMLHLDGLADSGDGLIAPMDRDRRLAVMRTPDVGAFGVVTVVVALLLQAAALASGPASVVLLAGLWALSRGLLAATAVVLPCARPGGMGALLADRRSCVAGAFGGVVPGAVMAAAAGWRGVAAVVGAVLGAAAVMTVARRRLGGYTGDVLGAVVVIAQTAGLVASTLHRP
jgi:adenosylcobinamide-GDP ribazoletransferase